MGYRSIYSIEVEPADMLDEIKAALQAEECPPDFPSIFDAEAWNGGGGLKWYDHKEHCAKVSKAFPAVTIVITRDGEDYEDTWRHTYKGGREVKREDLG